MAKFNIQENGNTDFDALLDAAKAKYAQMKAKVEECSYDASRLTEMHDAQNDWFDWCARNLTDRNIRMAMNPDGTPKALFVFVAGKED